MEQEILLKFFTTDLDILYQDLLVIKRKYHPFAYNIFNCVSFYFRDNYSVFIVRNLKLQRFFEQELGCFSYTDMTSKNVFIETMKQGKLKLGVEDGKKD